MGGDGFNASGNPISRNKKSVLNARFNLFLNQKLLESAFDVWNNVAYWLKLLSFFVRNFDTELFLESHY